MAYRCVSSLFSMKLLEFPHSHYCEKARWALDFKGIPFEAVAVMPGLHLFTIRRYAPDTAVPVLLNGKEVVQGSGRIIDYLDMKYPEHALTPTQPSLRQACLDIERDMDDRLGENIRRILYDSLLDYPDFIRHCFTHSMSGSKQRLFRLIYSLLRAKIAQTYVISAAAVEQSRHEFDVAMTEIEQLLQRGPYLVGGQFTRADLSVASMLSFLVMPPEHPFPWQEVPDPKTQTFYDQYQDHPVLAWASKIYRTHRASRANMAG